MKSPSSVFAVHIVDSNAGGDRSFLPSFAFLPVLFATAFILLGGAHLASGAEWLLSGDLGAHDPSLIREDGDYENGQWWWSVATGAGLAVKFSTDGLRWRQGLQIFTEENKPKWWAEHAPGMRPLNVWAPEIFRFGNRYWCYYTIAEFGKRNAAIGLTSASGIYRGDWRDDGVVLFSGEGLDLPLAVNQNFALDAEGNPWLAFGAREEGLHVVALDPQTMKPAPGASHVTVSRRSSEGALAAPHIVFHGGYYYLFASIDLCCNGKNSTQRIVYGRSRRITGPYEGDPRDAENRVSGMLIGSLTILERGDARWAGVGAPSVYPYRGGWIMIRHGYDKSAGGAQKMRINDLYWNADGWPTYIPPPLPDQKAHAGHTVEFVAPSSIAYQWQVSRDDGLTWSDVANGESHTGATAATLTVRTDLEMDGLRYRVLTGGGTSTSNSFLLEVSP